MNLVLPNGRKVFVDSLIYQPTYLGLLEGRPNRAINNRIIQRIAHETQVLWGKRPLHVIPPSVDLSDPAHPVLPPFRFVAWLRSHEPLRAENAGSELVVVWFRAEFTELTFAQIICQEVVNLAWEQLAADFIGD
jgi:hypothetical protein